MPARELAARVLLVLGSLAVGFALLEAGCRLAGSPHELLEALHLADRPAAGERVCMHVHDSALGWVLVPGCTSADFNVAADGYRVTPPLSASPLVAAPVVLATGSSFVEGDDVKDRETWPAFLQDRLGRRVVNAGVDGFSLDQTVLRTEQLVPALHPQVVVASFTPDDVHRTELRVAWTKNKPYFTLQEDGGQEDGGLALHNVPVPAETREWASLRPLSRLLGWSMLVDTVVRRLGLQEHWYVDAVAASPDGAGDEISCRLMRRLAEIGVPVLMVAQYGRLTWDADDVDRQADHRRSQHVLACAARAGLATLDTFDPVGRALTAEGKDALYRGVHHTPQGNRLVATAIAEAIEKLPAH